MWEANHDALLNVEQLQSKLADLMNTHNELLTK